MIEILGAIEFAAFLGVMFWTIHKLSALPVVKRINETWFPEGGEEE